MIVAALKETVAGERRVALVPAVVPRLLDAGFTVHVECGAGAKAGFSDEGYKDKGAHVADSRQTLLDEADVLLQVNVGSLLEGDDLERLRADQTLIALCDSLGNPERLQVLANCGSSIFALELVPRISRAQNMDVLSSMATVAGYKAAVLAADHLPRMFPMLITAAGTVAPARVFVLGAGVAGLQAIATARRLGAIVDAYDVRPVVKEQVESLGAHFVDLGLETSTSEDAAGYAKALGGDFYRRQQEALARFVARSTVVISTASVPGGRAPVLISAEMIAAMAPGSVIVDLAAERGGNCELTQADETVVEHGVTILGPTNLASTIPYHASEMFARNVTAFLKHLVRDGRVQLEADDEIIRETLVARGGAIVHERVRESLQASYRTVHEGGDR